MAVSFASVNPQNFELSPMRVKYKGVDLGGTLGNVVVGVETMKADLKADQFGETVLDRRVSGHKFTITMELAEVKFLDNWKVVFPNFKLIDTGSGKAIYVDSQVGRSDLSDAGQLLLHPLSLVDADLSGDYLFYLAIADAKSEITYGPTEQAKLKLVLTVLPDTGVEPARFFFHGDTSLGMVAAMAGSPSFTGTGNGTLTNVAVFSGTTKTETITVKAIAAATNGGTFEVTGSVSGPLGNAMLPGSSGGTVNFVSPVISFTLTDGSSDFALNDQFTIATTAANYA